MAKRKSYTVITKFTVDNIEMQATNIVWKTQTEEAKQIQRDWILGTKKNPTITEVTVTENKET